MRLAKPQVPRAKVSSPLARRSIMKRSERREELGKLLFHFLNLYPQAGPVTPSHYFPALVHSYGLLRDWIKDKEESNAP